MRYIKYLNEESAYYFINDLSLKYTPLHEFNDPFEGGIIVGSLDDTEIAPYSVKLNLDNREVIYDKYLVELEELKHKVDIQHAINQLCSNEGIACLCLSKDEKADNALMWAHYSGNHKGMAISFDPTHSYFNAIDNVHYTSKRLVLNEKIFGDYSENLPINTFFAKEECWAYEQEVRLSKLQSKLEVSGLENQQIFKDKVPIDAIKTIYIGYKASPEFKDKVVEFCWKHSIHYIFLELKKDSYGLTLNVSDKRSKRQITFDQMFEMRKY